VDETQNSNPEVEKYLDSDRFRRDFFGYKLPEETRLSYIFLNRTPMAYQTPPVHPEDVDRWRLYPIVEQHARFGQRALGALYNLRRGLDMEADRLFLEINRDRMLYGLLREYAGRMNYMIARNLVGESFPPHSYGAQKLPQRLNAVCATPWQQRDWGTPCWDVKTMIDLGHREFSEHYDRLTMTTPDFSDLIHSNDFVDTLNLMVSIGEADRTLPMREGRAGWLKLAAQVLRVKEVEVCDELFTDADPMNGYIRRQVITPGTVIFSNTADDGNAHASDFFMASPPADDVKRAGLPVEEGVREPGGPLLWMDCRVDLNPPDVAAKIKYYGAPRKHRESMVAVLHVAGSKE